MYLLTFNNPKTQKGVKFGYLTAILHLAPSDLSGTNVCPKASPECRALCLNTAGRGGIIKTGETTNRIQECRIRRTKLLFEKSVEFFRQLDTDIARVVSTAAMLKLKPAIRLNGTSDIQWEKIPSPISGITIFEMWPGVQFYDYTKIPNRKVPSNYYLTFSLSENNASEALTELENGRNIAVVFHTVPTEYAGRTVVNGDESDLRFLDPDNVIVGLKAKGRAKKSHGKFVK